MRKRRFVRDERRRKAARDVQSRSLTTLGARPASSSSSPDCKTPIILQKLGAHTFGPKAAVLHFLGSIFLFKIKGGIKEANIKQVWGGCALCVCGVRRILAKRPWRSARFHKPRLFTKHFKWRREPRYARARRAVFQIKERDREGDFLLEYK